MISSNKAVGFALDEANPNFTKVTDKFSGKHLGKHNSQQNNMIKLPNAMIEIKRLSSMPDQLDEGNILISNVEADNITPTASKRDKLKVNRPVSAHSSRSNVHSSGQVSQQSAVSSKDSACSYGSRRSARSKTTTSNKMKKPLTVAQQQLAEIEDKFKSLRHLPKQRLHPFDFAPEELEDMKKLFPEFKPIPEHKPQNRPVKSHGIFIQELVTELQKRIKIDDRAFHRMINQCDRKNDNKVTWNEFLNFLTNEGTRRETVNDAQLYGYGVKRLKKQGRYHLRTVNQYAGPDKLAEYYIDGMVLIKLKNIKLLLNIFENKEAKLYDLRTLQPIQHLIFQSDYSVPKPKKVDQRRKAQDANTTNLESISTKQNTTIDQQDVYRGLSMPSLANHMSEANDSASMASFKHMNTGMSQVIETQDGPAQPLQKQQTEEHLTQIQELISEVSSVQNTSQKRSKSMQPQTIARQITKTKKNISSAIDSKVNSKSKEVNFHPPSGDKAGKQTPSKSVSATNQQKKAAITNIQNFADVDIDITVELKNPAGPTGKSALKNQMSIPISKVKQNSQMHGNLSTLSEPGAGSASTAAGRRKQIKSQYNRGGPQRPQTQTANATMMRDGSDSDFNNRSVSQINSWKHKDSFHWEKLKEQRIIDTQKKIKEEKEMKNPNVLGLADLASKNSARDFMDRQNEKSKQKMNLNRALADIADHDVDIYQQKRDNEREFKAYIEIFDQKMRKYDKNKEEQFFKVYKEKERADDMTRDQSYERIGIQDTLAADSTSTGPYRSAANSRLQGTGLKPNRPNTQIAREIHSSSRASRTAAKSAKKDHHSKDSLMTKGKKFNIINDQIDYLGRNDLVERTVKQTKYVPLALRHIPSVIKLSDQQIEKLSLEKTKCERALKATTATKNDCMKKVLRVKEANRFFFTQNPLSPPYYYPEFNPADGNAQQIEIEQQMDQGSRDQKQIKRENSPRTQAKIDYKLLFGNKDDQDAIPCDAGMIKKALDDRKKRDVKFKQAMENAAYLKQKEKDKKITRKIKTTKEIYTVAADFCQSKDGEKSIVALALIDGQILVYQVKQSGVKISMVEEFSFYAKFPGKAVTVSALCLDHYVTDSRPIICLGSQLGDIAIYYLDHVNKDGKIGPKLIQSFNFFERGINKVVSDEGSDDNEDVDSLLDQGTTKKGFVFKVNSQIDQKSRVLNSMSENEEEFSQSSNENQSKAADHLRLTSQQFSTAIVEASKQIQDDFWEVLMNTREKERDPGPDGIALWNRIYKKVKDQESAITLCKSLIQMKLDSLDKIDEIIERWQLCMKQNGNLPKDALLDFDNQMQRLREEKIKHSQLQSIKKNFSRSKSNSQQASQQKTASTKKVRQRGKALTAKKDAKAVNAKSMQRQGTRKDSFQLNSIIEDKFENNSTLGDDLPVIFENQAVKQGQKGLDGKTVKQQGLNAQKTPKNPISKLKYIKDIGLIITAFNGTIKFFDSFNFHQIWKNDNKIRSENQHTSIGTFDVSSPLGIMVTGGAEGLMLAIDPHALGVTNQAEAHKGKDILNVFIFDEQQQIISVCEDRSVCLWDAFRLVKLQTIKDQDEDIHIPKFSSASFDAKSGQLYIGDQLLSLWKCATDPIVEINALQIQTLSTQMAKERNMQQLIDLSDTYSKQPSRTTDSKTGNVLISKMSSLVEILSNDTTSFHNYFATVDTENLVRFWNLKEHNTNITFKIPMKKRVTACDMNKECTLIAIGNQIGEAFVANSKSGGIIYKLSGADEEIGSIKFLSGQSEFWIVAALWHGKMVFWTQPNEQNNFTINAKVRIGHRGDINTLDCQANYIISGGQDGLLGVWNQFSGVLKYAIKLPDPVDTSHPLAQEMMKNATDNANADNASLHASQQASSQIRRTIVGLMFHPFWKNVALVLQEGGNIHAVDVSNGMIVNDFLAMVQMNSSWAIDPYNYLMMVVGDQGKAILYDASMGARIKNKKKKEVNFFSYAVKEKKAVHTKRVPVLSTFTNPVTGEKNKWRVVRNWFTAHTFSKTEPHYVNIVKYAKAANLFITSTNFGEVRLWDNQSCMALGKLNSNEFRPGWVMSYIKRSNDQEDLLAKGQEKVYNALQNAQDKMKIELLGPN